MSRRRASLATALAVVVLAAGCGSTAQRDGSVAAARSGDAGLRVSADGTVESSASSSGDGGATIATVPGGSGSSAASPRGSSGAPTAPSSSPGSSSGGGPESGRGFTKDTVYIGVGTADDYQALADSFGVEGVGYTGDPNVWMKAVVEDVNRRGGLAGRDIVLVKHDYNTAQLLNDPATAHQAACATWVEDNEVFAVLLAGLLVDDSLLGCLAKAGTPLVQVGAGADYPLHYRKTYIQYPLYFNLAQMVGERYDRIAIGRLVARRFFEPWDTRSGRAGGAGPTKVGLIGFDDPDGEIQLASWQDELARHGLTDTSIIRCPRPLTDKIQCEQSAVLRFTTDRVTHVFGADTIFMNQADTQGYRPRYFVAVATRAFAANAPARQLIGAMGEGYVPYSDVERSEYPGDPSPATAACEALMADANQASSDPSTLLLQLSVCDEFSFVKAATDLAGALGPDALRAGMEGLGDRQASALTFRSFLGPGEHTNAAALRDLEYRGDIQRFAYVSATDHVG